MKRLSSVCILIFVLLISVFLLSSCNGKENENGEYAYATVDGIKYSLLDGEATVIRQSSSIDKADIPSSINYNGKAYSVTGISASAFSECYNLISVKIPSSVKNIGASAFYRCESLIIYCEAQSQPEGWNSCWNPSSCPVVFDCANNDVASDTYTYTVSDGIIYALKDGNATVARQPRSITEANIPSSVVYKDTSYSVTQIRPSAFFRCAELTSVSIPDTVTSISDKVFWVCTSLAEITIPSSVKRIGSYAFSECKSLVSITIPDGVTSIGESAFYYCTALTSITLPDSVGSIERFAFASCNALTSIVIPSRVAVIGDSAFFNCYSLTDVTISSGVVSIGPVAFGGCKSLVSIEIPNSVTDIANAAFTGCRSLTSIVIPKSVTRLDNGVFLSCDSLTVYCESESKPDGWNTNWNYDQCPVIWGYNR